MALANNLGVLHARLGEYEKAESFFRHLLSTQMFVVTCSCPAGEPSAISSVTNTDNASPVFHPQQEGATVFLEGFWNNTMQLVLSNRSASAA